jgi:hypothetical protein
MKQPNLRKCSPTHIQRKQCNSGNDAIVHKAVVGSVLLTKYLLGDKIEKNGIGGARSTYREEQRCIQGIGGEI